METSIEGQELPGLRVASDTSGEICPGIPGSSIHILGCVLRPWFYPLVALGQPCL